jgi:putative SOS response-associated peptidase YedK
VADKAGTIVALLYDENVGFSQGGIDMCFYFSNSRRALDLANRYGRKTGFIEAAAEIQEAKYRITAFTHPACPVITPSEIIETAKWGLIPAWAKTVEEAGKLRKMCLNARTEGVFNLPSFRNSILTGRCLIPATGYFEFHHRDKSVTPYYIFLPDEEIFSFGGLYERWRNPATGETTQTFTILTVPANKLCSEIHNGGKNPYRMPLIVGRENESRWLDGSLNRSDIERLFQPFDTNLMDAYPVSNDFLKKKPDDASIIDPAR